MLTLLSEEPGEIAQFRAEPWPFQQTFKTPLKELHRFVSIFLTPFSFAEGVVSTGEVVFEPKNILHLLANNSLSVEDQYHFMIRAVGQQAIVDLLEATLAYFRLHGSPRRYYSAYSNDYLNTLAAQLKSLVARARAWCIFDNTAGGSAAQNALDLAAKLRTTE